MEELIRETNFQDELCAESFRKGAPILNSIPAAASAEKHDYPLAEDVNELARSCRVRNRELLESLRKDPNEVFLMEQVKADAGAGRMTTAVRVSELDLDTVLLARRFSLEQGQRANGEPKLRAVDDMTANGVNSCARATGKNRNDGIDMLVRCAVMVQGASRRAPAFWKADIDSAFRRVPLMPNDKWSAWITFLHEGVPMAAGHLALMFGGLGSVHGWDRIGDLLRHLGRRLLFLALGRYVDDYFAADVREAAGHAMECFARLVRALLGPSSVKVEKLESGVSLEVLGLLVTYDECGVRVKVSERKAVQWASAIEEVLASGVLASGLASKLAGRLSFAAQNTFRRAGRAALRPLFRQQYAPLRGSRVGAELRMCLEWWLEALKNMRAQVVKWDMVRETATLLTDARSTPPRVAAVLIVGSQFYYTDWAPDQAILQTFTARRDNQIMGLELLGIAVGLSTFASLVKGKSLRVYCDNVGGERALAAGASRSDDHNRMIHATWMLAMQLDVSLWVDRVPTKENIADLPSRESYQLMKQVCEMYKKKKGEK
jgi:hypothetical protein